MSSNVPSASVLDISQIYEPAHAERLFGPLIHECRKRPTLQVAAVMGLTPWILLMSWLVLVPVLSLFLAGGICWLLSVPMPVWSTPAGKLILACSALIVGGTYAFLTFNPLVRIRSARLVLHRDGLYIYAPIRMFRNLRMYVALDDLKSLDSVSIGRRPQPPHMLDVEKLLSDENWLWLAALRWSCVTLKFRDGREVAFPSLLQFYDSESLNTFFQYLEAHRPGMITIATNLAD